MIRIIVLICLLLLGSCAYLPFSRNGLKTYHELLPEKEEINASLYNYELICGKMAANCASGLYMAALSNALEYLGTFQAEDERGVINYYLAESVLRMVTQFKDFKYQGN